MARPKTGVLTIAGRLTSILDELRIPRRMLADRADVSDRTIRHVERGDKPVSHDVLQKLVDAVNELWAEQHEVNVPESFSADNLIADPRSVIRAFSQLYVHLRDGPVPWLAELFDDGGFILEFPGRRQGIPFAGKIRKIAELVEYFRTLFEKFEIDARIKSVPRIYGPAGSSYAALETMHFMHRGSGEKQPFLVCTEFVVRGIRISELRQTYNTAAMIKFLKTGTLGDGLRDPKKGW